MFRENDLFQQPGENTLLWRYQDIPRYIDMLLRNQLFFCKADRFKDPFEGKFSVHQRKEIMQQQNDKNGEKDEQPEEALKPAPDTSEINRSLIAINSWHINTDENYAMWKIYGKGSYGLAIQTTYERLKQSFRSTDKDIYIAMVNYSDESPNTSATDNHLMDFIHKRKIYQYENEIRCCYVIGNEKNFNWEEQDTYNGVFIDIDLNTLIKRIYISPYSPPWIQEIVVKINQKFELNKETVHSKVFDLNEY